MSEVKAPWLKFYGVVPEHIEYSKRTMALEVYEVAKKYPDYTAYTFFGRKFSYAKAAAEIEKCAKALWTLGVREGQKVTVCMPNCPQAITMFYAINRVGAIASMVHPLSGEKEIEFYLNDAESVAALTLDQFCGKFMSVWPNTPALKNLIVASVADEMSPVMKIGYALTKGRGVPKAPKKDGVLTWKDFMAGADRASGFAPPEKKAEEGAAILYSGGTTGVTKGILLSNLNFNALGDQVVATNPMFAPGDRMLAIMPMFHGFGLGVSIHTMLTHGGCCILVPQFTPKSYADLLRKEKPNFIAGVPTLYEALLRIEGLDDLDLSCLKGVFSGGDSLTPELKKRFDAFLKEHKSKVEVREGYGTTECVTASCLTPYHMSREGSIGIPFPDTFYKIVKVGTDEEMPYGEEGEICISGPSVMLEYVNHPQETADTLRVHADGRTWVHTGDLGIMDSDGFIYFRQRIKRMIITSGYNVYPSQVENILDAHEYVHMSCVIGVKDAYKMQKVKAYVMLKPGYEPSEKIKNELLEYCRLHLAKYAVPYDIEFRAELPKTLVGKVAYRVLEEEAARESA
ncbi:MAG: AMP-binding protein [Oscillospiraceae bacterium]|nr:AMP-binding protein [Oscillospiraceae bacterium]